MITKEQLTDAHEQGLSISTRNGNIKIVTILGDVYGVNHCDTNSKLVKWWMFENFERNEAKIERNEAKIERNEAKIERNEAKIEQPKPKYNGRAVKCYTVDQLQWLFKTLADSNYEIKNIDINNCFNITIVGFASEKYYIENNYEIISFSDYCKEQGIKEPKWIQGFEVKDGYNDVVMVSSDNINWHCHLLTSVNNNPYPFYSKSGGSWSYCRYPKRNEINEIKFVD